MTLRGRPQSTIRSVEPYSTSAALPRLPLPSAAKRSVIRKTAPREPRPAAQCSCGPPLVPWGEYIGMGNCATLPPSAVVILPTPCLSTSSIRST